MEKLYPIDIAGINNIGLEKWLENYYIPVTGKEYYKIYKDIFSAYLSVLKQYNHGVVYWIASSNITTPVHVSRYILELLRFIRLKDKGYDYIVGQKKERIPEDISTFEFSSISNINMIGKKISKLTLQERAKNILRTIKYNISPRHFTNKYFLKNISKPVFFIGDITQHEVVSFCRENGIAPIHLSSMILAKQIPVRINNDSQYVEMMEFIMNFLNLVRKQHPIIGNSTFELLRRAIEECFSYSLIYFRQNIRFFSKHKPKNLLATGLGIQIHRLYCSAWRYSGGKVTGFSHGNSYSHGYTPNVFKVLSMVDQYIVLSKGNEEIIRQAAKKFMPDYKKPDIVHLKNNVYKPLFERLQIAPPVSTIKRIMVVGNVRINYAALDTEYHAFARLYHQLEIVKLLKDNGYYVIYKPRPDSSTETKAIFETYASEVLTDRFEDVYHYADCLLFSAPYSTTFGFSLLTNKPIVLMNAEGYPWYPRAFELIKKRCSVFDAKSVDGKIIFNEQDVLAAVQESINNINYDILHEFAF